MNNYTPLQMKPSRRSIRLNGYDYSTAGAYFVTICAHNQKCLFGKIEDGIMMLNEYGKIIQFTWDDLANHNGNIELDEFIVMPNHIHGIIMIVGAGSKPAIMCERAGLEPAPTHGLWEIVRQFKTFSAKRIMNCVVSLVFLSGSVIITNTSSVMEVN